MKQPISYQLVDTAGEITAVISQPASIRMQPALAQRIMEQTKGVEQVMFVDATSKGIPRLRMMGGELSVNGILAAATIVMRERNIVRVRLLNGPIVVTASRRKEKACITLPSSVIKSVEKNRVTFTGMRYLLQEGFPKIKRITKNLRAILSALTNDAPASGIIYYQDSHILPLVYVKATQSIVWEQSCGSGSIAFALYAKKRRITQPSGKGVSVAITDRTIRYEADACLLGSVLIR